MDVNLLPDIINLRLKVCIFSIKQHNINNCNMTK